MFSDFAGIFREFLGMFREEIKGRRDLKRAQVDAEIALASRRATAEIDWDMVWAEQARTSWKDEWFVILHSIPVILCFIPGMAGYVQMGFETLRDSVPDWFIMFYGAGVSAAFGIRRLSDVMRLTRPKSAGPIVGQAAPGLRDD